MKNLVIYYSLNGNTKKYAMEIAKEMNADLFEIKTQKSLPKNKSGQMFIGGMQASLGLKPALSNKLDGLDQYNKIIIGTPIWAGKCAPAIASFLAKYNIHNKVIGVFTTSGSGNNQRCITKFKTQFLNLKDTVSLLELKKTNEEVDKEKLIQFVNRVRTI